MMTHVAPRIVVEPLKGLIDQPRNIRLEGFEPDSTIELDASLRQFDDSLWRSTVTFRADRNGSVDLASTAPIAGSYREVSAMGVVWSMRRDMQATASANGSRSPIDPIQVRLTARGAGGLVAEASFEQHFLAPGVTRREIRESGLVGTLFLPAGSGPYPAVMVLSGSGGGILEPRASLYAAHGYAALALGYFRAPGLPEHIDNIPLEYFETALEWMRHELAPARNFVAVVGQSRGGELALLLGATFPDSISAVVAYVPSAVTHGSLSARPAGGDRNAVAWTLRGKSLPIFGQDNKTMDWSLVDNAPSPRRQAPAFVSGLEDADAIARAMIPVERIAGPVLLISGADDGLWPSTPFSDLAMDRLQGAMHPYPDRHLRFEDTGHYILFPYVPTTMTSKSHPVSKVELVAGGTPEGNARANEASWREVRAFLAAAFDASQVRRGVRHAPSIAASDE